MLTLSFIDFTIYYFSLIKLFDILFMLHCRLWEAPSSFLCWVYEQQLPSRRGLSMQLNVITRHPGADITDYYADCAAV